MVVTQLSEFYNYKNQLMQDLLTNEKIVKLLGDETDMASAGALAYTQVFPYEYVPEAIEKGYAYIYFDVDIQSVSNKTFLQPALYVWVIAHKSRLRLPDGGGVRTDALCSEICETINGSRYYGLGHLDLYSVKRYAPLIDYNGKVMTFYASEYNRTGDAKRSVPSNRVTG